MLKKSVQIAIPGLKSIQIVSLLNKTCATEIFVKHGTNDFLCINLLCLTTREICLAFTLSKSMNLLKHFFKFCFTKLKFYLTENKITKKQASKTYTRVRNDSRYVKQKSKAQTKAFSQHLMVFGINSLHYCFY